MWCHGCGEPSVLVASGLELCGRCAAALPLVETIATAAACAGQGAPEPKATGGAQRLGKITSSVSVPSTGKDRTDGKY